MTSKIASIKRSGGDDTEDLVPKVSSRAQTSSSSAAKKDEEPKKVEESREEKDLRKAKKKLKDIVKGNPNVQSQIKEMIAKIKTHAATLNGVITEMEAARAAMEKEKGPVDKVGDKQLKAVFEDVVDDFNIANGIIGAMVRKLNEAREKRSDAVEMLDNVAESTNIKDIKKTRDFVKEFKARK